MNSGFKILSRTPTEPSHIEILASASTNIYFGAYPARDSATTLVGDLPPPRSSEAKSPQSIPSQKATSSRETPDPASRPYPVTPTISARRRPVCKTCGTPRKGHKRGTCTPCPTPDEHKSLYASSPERERTPTKASAFVEALAQSLKTPTQSTSTISSVITAISAGGKRRPIHGTCGLPMKGHKRQNGTLICPSDHNQDPMSSLRIKALKGMDQKPGYLDSPSDRPLHKDHLLHHSGSVKHERDAIPTSISSYTRSSNAQIKRVVHVSPTGDKSRSQSPNPFVSSDSLDRSISVFAPSIASGSQSTVTMPSISALNDALGEPALAIYPAWNRDEVSQIREQAKASHFFSGVVNVKIEETDGLDLTRAIRRGDVDDHEAPSSHYMKWVIVSGEKEMVQKCIDLCAERPLEL